MTNISKSDTEGKPDRTASVNWTRLKELAGKATARPWDRRSGTSPNIIIGLDRRQIARTFADNAVSEDEGALNAAFVTELVNAFPAILEEVERLRAALRTLSSPTLNQDENNGGFSKDWTEFEAGQDSVSQRVAEIARAALTKEQ